MSEIIRQTLDVKQVATMIGCSTACVYNMTREGQIPHKKIRSRLFFHREVIEQWLKGEAG